MNHLATAILPAIIHDDMLYIKALFCLERKYPVIEEIYSSRRNLGGVELAEGKGSIGIHRSLMIDSANTLEGADKKGVLA